MELKNDEFQALRLKVDQISSELDKQNTVRVVNTKWMIIVGAVILASLGFTSFVQLPREAARAAEKQVGQEIKDEANRILSDLQKTHADAKVIERELGEITELQKIANLPIGTIVPSMLQPSLFAEAVGDVDRDTPEWVLADGQKDVTNSQYGQLTGNTKPPDLRGVFLRGMNVKGGKDPQQNRTAGDYQEDAFKEHDHGLYWHHRSFKGADPPGIPAVDKPGSGQPRPFKKLKEGKAETRPKNVAVYFYIKIN